MANTTGFSYQEIQKVLVQALFTEQTAIPKVSAYVSSDDFIDENYKSIYIALISLSNVPDKDKRKATISIYDIYDWANKNDKAINNEALAQLSRPVLESPQSLAEILKRLSVQYKTKLALAETAKKLENDSPQTLENISELETRLNELSTSLIINNKEKTLAEELEEFSQHIQKKEKDEVDTIPLFNPCLNRVLNNGWQQEKLIVIGARTGVGKSVYAVDSTVAACNAGRSVLFFSLEMSRQELYKRLLAVQSDVILNKLEAGTDKSEEEISRINTSIEQMKQWKLEIDDTPGVTAENIAAKAKLKAMSAEGLDMIIVDYLQLITPTSVYSRKSRQEQVAEISRQMKLLAKTLKVPVMVLVQLNRLNKKDENVDELPTKDEIRESNAIAQDADVILLIHRKFKEDETDPKATFIIDKNRGGAAPRTFKVRCVLEKSAFRDLSPDEDETENLDIDTIDTEQEELHNDEAFFDALENFDFEENFASEVPEFELGDKNEI